MNLEPVPVEALAPAARKFAGPNVPDAAKMMAARGLAPLAPRDLCSVLAFLAYDEAEAVSVAAKKTLAALPERILDGALRDKQHPAVLHAMARSLVSSARWAELLLLNPLTDDELSQVFRGAAAGAIPGAQAEEVLAALWSLDEAPSLGRLVAATQPGAKVVA